ncbi:MAG: hypothetical protein ACFFBD_29140, partial [Candidatus Hodarchaeota archaeon]
KIEGFLDERVSKEFIPFVSAVRLIKNVPNSKVLPVGKDLAPDLLQNSPLKYYPSEGLLNSIVRQHRDLIAIIESFLDQVENEIKNLEREFRTEKAEQEQKVKQGIIKAEQVRDKIVREQDELVKRGPTIPFPTPGDMLETYLKRIDQSFREIRSSAQKKSVDLSLKVCKDARNQLRNTSNFISEYEEEINQYRKAIEELERNSLREKKRATEECEAEKKRLENEMHQILQAIRKNIEDLTNLIKKVEEARDMLNAEHSKWVEIAQREISETNDLIVPLEFFDHDPGVPFRLYLTVYVAQYNTKRRTRRVFFEPMSLLSRGRRHSIVSNLALKNFVETIEKRFIGANREIKTQIDEAILDDRINDLRRQVAATAFSIGMKLLLEKKIIDPKTALRVNNAYDEHFRLIMSDK